MPDLTALEPATFEAPADHGQQCLTSRQIMLLKMPLDRQRVRSLKGNSYVEAWDVKAHLTRVFGFTGWDSHVVEYRREFEREYMSAGDPSKNIDPKPMIEVCYSARLTLMVRCQHGYVIGSWTEAAAGQANCGEAVATRGESHDNAIKQAESNALKRTAISLGTQFGLSLYNNGSTSDVIGRTMMDPDMLTSAPPEVQQALNESLGVKVEGGEMDESGG